MTFSARNISRVVTTAAIATVFTLSACSSGTPSSSASPTDVAASAAPSASSSPQSTVIASHDLSGVNVSDGATPDITVAAPWGIASTQTKVLKKGGSQLITETSTVTVNYLGVNGTTGQAFDSSYAEGRVPATFELRGMIAGFREGLAGQAVGSRVLIGIAPSDGYPTGNEGASIAAGDSLLFVVDILAANFEEATGEAVTPEAGLPTVTMGDNGPTIKVDAGTAAPTQLVVQPLIKGAGPAITENSVVEVRYRAWDYATGAVVKDAWVKQSGVLANLITGWKEGLKGQTSGSRVMLVIPSDKAYNDGKTLVYVIDVLNVTG